MPRRATSALIVAALCIVALAACGVLALTVQAAHARDDAVLEGFKDLDLPGLELASKILVLLVDPLPYALWGAALIWVALADGRHWRAAAVAAVLVLTGATTQVLKHTLPHTRLAWVGSDDPGLATWPSGHATAAMTIALCAVIVAPPALRLLSGLLGGLLALGVAYANFVLSWHYPSDVLAGFLVAGLWTALAVAALSRLEPSRAVGPRRSRSGVLLPLSLAVAGAVVGAVALAARPDAVTIYGGEVLMAGALAIAGLAGALLAAAARGSEL